MLSPRVPELSALEMLAAVHRLGSFSAAGRQLGLSQQAVSSRMGALERLVGAPLFVRRPGGSALTPTGVLVSEWAGDVLAAAERLDAGLDAMRARSLSPLRVVASQTVAEYLVPHWLVGLRRRQLAAGAEPTLVELEVGNSATVVARVRDGDAAVGFIETPRVPSGLAHRTVQQDELVVVTAPDHPWARRRTPLSAAELAATALVTREVGSGTREALDTLLASALPGAVPAAPAIELSTTAAVRQAVAAGSAPAVLSALAVHDDLTLGRLVAVPLADVVLRRPLTAIWTGSRTPPPGPARDLLAVAARPGGLDRGVGG